MKRYRLVLFTAILLVYLSTTVFGQGQAAAGDVGNMDVYRVVLQPPNPCGPNPCGQVDEYGEIAPCELREFLVWASCNEKYGVTAVPPADAVPAPELPTATEKVELVVQIGFFPNPPKEGDAQVTFTADVRGQTATEANTLRYTWFLDGIILCEVLPAPGVCTWADPAAGHHSIQVIVESPVTGRRASNALGLDVLKGEATPDVSKEAGFSIGSLSCSSGITSDDTLSCNVTFDRTSDEADKLTVVWQVDGYTASTQTTGDSGAFFSMDKPAPGDHTVSVVVTNADGVSRSKTSSIEVFEGSNADLPPGAQAGAAAGTLTGIGVWIWLQYAQNRASMGPRIKPVRSELGPETTESEETPSPGDETSEESEEPPLQEETEKKKQGGSPPPPETKKRDTDAEQEKKKPTAEGSGSEAKKQAEVNREKVEAWYNSARMGDFVLGGNLPETPVKVPSTWDLDSPLWKALWQHLPEEEQRRLRQAWDDKSEQMKWWLDNVRILNAVFKGFVNLTSGSPAGINLIDSPPKEVDIEPLFEQGPKVVDGYYDYYLPDIPEVYAEPLVFDQQIADQIDTLKMDAYESYNSYWAKFWHKPYTRDGAKKALAYFHEKQEYLANRTGGPLTEAEVTEYQQYSDTIAKLNALLAHPRFR